MLRLLERLAVVDRRVIFIIIALAVIIPVYFPVGLPIKPTTSVESAYDCLKKLPHHSLILCSFDYGPSTAVEIHPMALAIMNQAMKADDKIACMGLLAEGQALAQEAVATTLKNNPGKKYGVDIVNLGFKAGGESVLVAMGLNFRSQFSTDARGTPLSAIPMLKKVSRLDQFALVYSFTSGTPGGLEHIRVTASQYGRPLIIGCTAVQTPQYYPFYTSGQIKGLLGGLRGAAEYEKLSGYHGTATPGMDAQSIAHFVIAFFIIFANVVYFLEKAKLIHPKRGPRA